jgi:hypothetical protein
LINICLFWGSWFFLIFGTRLISEVNRVSINGLMTQPHMFLLFNHVTRLLDQKTEVAVPSSSRRPLGIFLFDGGQLFALSTTKRFFLNRESILVLSKKSCQHP